MFICDKNNSCCSYSYWDRWEDVEQDAKECGHLVEVAPVVHAKLENYPSDMYRRCSACKMEWEKSRLNIRANRCPNCGAKWI